MWMYKVNHNQLPSKCLSLQWFICILLTWILWGQYEVETAWRSASSDRRAKKKKPKITPRCSLSPLLWQLKDCLPLSPLTGSPPEQSGMQKAGDRQSRGTSPSATRKPPKPRPSWNHLSLGVLQTSCCWLRAAHTSTAPIPLGLHTPYPRDVHTDHLCLIPALSLKTEYR